MAAARKATRHAATKRAAPKRVRAGAAPQVRAGNGDALARYREKRNFALTPEPAEGVRKSAKTLGFVIQKHAASHLHYDFRLELDGTLKSWAVPKGPSLDTKVKRMAVQVEDHPVSYGGFEGVIPAGQYGAGTVIVWDKGTWAPVGDAREGLRKGELKFELHGHKLKGKWVLVRMKPRDGERQPAWLLIKEKDGEVRAMSEFDVVEAMPDSVLKKGKGSPVAAQAKPVAQSKAKNKSAASKPAVANPPSAKPASKRAARGKPKSLALPEGAAEAALPATLAPQLATLVEEVPADGDWIYEIKFDGYRLLTRIDGEKVQCFTRNGHDWSAKLPDLVKAVQAMQLGAGWLDGEIIVPNAQGLPDFQALQNAFDAGNSARIEYFVFDLPYYAGHDLRGVPLEERRALLEQLVGTGSGKVHYSAAFDAAPADLLASARKIGLEGVIGKRPSSTYASRRSPSWIKLKVGLRQEFVIGGYTDPKGSRAGLGSLMLGVHDTAGKLVYAGNVGTGFDDDTLVELQTQLAKFHTERCPFDKIPPSVRGPASSRHWVRPQLVAEVSFGNWTNDGHVRHSVFMGLRTDKPARAIVREAPTHVPRTSGRAATSEAVKEMKASTKAASTKAAGTGAAKAGARKTVEKKSATKAAVPKASANSTTAAAAAAKLPGRVSHPDRVIDPSTGTTKLDLINYYMAVAPLILPHLARRPVSLVRAPDGIEGELFFQKHDDRTSIPGITVLDARLDTSQPALLEIDDLKALFGAAQMNTVELHTWNATVPKLDLADRITFDLDPGEGLAWPKVREAAQLMRELLKELGLAGMLKTSGGKGLHIVVPIKRGYDWETVKGFSQAVVQHIAGVIPERFVAKSGPKNRIGKLFVDYLRNSKGATTVAAWSVRARPGLGVSVPVAWEELGKLSSGAHWNLANVAARMKIGNNPWQAGAVAPQSLAKAMKLLGYKPK